uniref:Uncharacterized protein n=1 Tax=Anguilla anguilla TaxID=7936 RepID=A0A0E9WM57_ANGAN
MVSKSPTRPIAVPLCCFLHYCSAHTIRHYKTALKVNPAGTFKKKTFWLTCLEVSCLKWPCRHSSPLSSGVKNSNSHLWKRQTLIHRKP